jgi:serine protease AprX
MPVPVNLANFVGREDEDVSKIVFSARIRRGKTFALRPRLFKRGWVTRMDPEAKRVSEPEPEPIEKRDKIHPVLRELLKTHKLKDRMELVVVFRENTPIPRFPEPDDRQPRDSAVNQRLLRRADELVKGITEKRQPGYRELEPLFQELEGKILETFWIIRAVLVEMPLKSVARLAEYPEVVSIEPRESGETPPQTMISNGRAHLNSDPYFNLGQTSGWIGLLDTGLRFSHTLYTNPSHIDGRIDCVTSGSAADPSDDCWNHGTSTGAIITGNNNLTDDHRGVTAITLDSLKVYPSGRNSAGNCRGLDTAAVLRAFQRAINILDRVIVAEMQASSDDLGSISQAADAAFSAGAVVIAANGNSGPNAKTVNAPANAHRVIGVGAFDVQTGNLESYQSRGPTRDNRFKPDIQAPTNTESASNTSDTAVQNFGGTSGATPYGAGAAALLRNWLRSNSGSIDPGQVYAQMILSGQTPYPFDNDTGAGHIHLPTDGWAWWGKVNVNNHDNIEVPIPIGSHISRLDAALWWPEFVFNFFIVTIDIHNDIDLRLVDPSGHERALSFSVNSVFERAQVNGGITPGTWKVRITGYNVPAAPQAVYWTVAALL